MFWSRIIAAFSLISSAVLLSCAGEPPKLTDRPAGRADAVRTRETEDARLFHLVRYDNAAVPQPVDLGESCPRIIHGGWIRFTGARWESADSLAASCPADSMPVRPLPLAAGTLRRIGDTLVFDAYDPKLRKTLEVQRGLIHGDTLYAGALLFDGPALVYLRR